MAYSSGTAEFNDGTIKYFCYNHITDICIPKLYDTSAELEDNWGKSNFEEEKCEHELEEVTLYTCYGGGIYWEGEACKKCNRIIKNLNPYYLEDEDDLDSDVFLDSILKGGNR